MICSKGYINAPRIPKLKNVLFVDSLKDNLINISQICDDRSLVQYIDKECTMYDSFGRVMVKGIKLEDKYYCDGDTLSFI